MSKSYLTTESISQNKKFIDEMLDDEAITFLLEDQIEAARVVKNSISSIKLVSDEVYKHLIKYKNGRLIYIGSGSSGRIGIQDVVELIPTFGWAPQRIDFIIAGGQEALVRSIEDAEDDIDEAVRRVAEKKISKEDIVIAISANGNTPFTLKAAKECKKQHALTISITNNNGTHLSKNTDYNITLLTGAEAVAGSTRLKAGTAQKICLNTISTYVMIKMGRVKNGRMFNLLPMNEKLRKRLDLINKHLNF